MATPWQKLRDDIASRTALEGLALFDDGMQALTDAETRDSSTSEPDGENAHTWQALRLRGLPRLSLDSDELLNDFEGDINAFEADINAFEAELQVDEEGGGILDEGGDFGLELDDFEKELIGEGELGGLDDFEKDMETFEEEIEDFEQELLTGMDIDSPGSDISAMFRLEDESIGVTNHAILDTILPSWDESDDAPADIFDEDDAEADVLMGMLLMGMAEEAARMRGPYGQIPTSQDWFSVSMQWKGDRFRSTYRMSPRTFRRIVRLLEHNPIFQSSGNRPQRPVAHQLACFLVRYGSSASNGFQPAAKLSVGVGTVYYYCRRVTRALREIGLKCVAWPNNERKKEIKKAFEEISHIPGCIGAGDGTLIRLTRKPQEGGDDYVCYKGYAAINLFAIVDHEKRFIAHEGGWVGSKSDRTTFRGSYVWKHRGKLISRSEHVLVDKGFFSTPYTCRPYGRKELDESGNRVIKKRRNSFNKKLSRGRVVVENAFGMLKQRFPAAGYMGTSANINTLHRALEALIAVHNLCIDYGDKALAQFGDYSQDDSDYDEPEFDLFNFPGHIDPRIPLPEGGWEGFESDAELLAAGNRYREFLRGESYLRALEAKEGGG